MTRWNWRIFRLSTTLRGYTFLFPPLDTHFSDLTTFSELHYLKTSGPTVPQSHVWPQCLGLSLVSYQVWGCNSSFTAQYTRYSMSAFFQAQRVMLHFSPANTRVLVLSCWRMLEAIEVGQVWSVNCTSYLTDLCLFVSESDKCFICWTNLDSVLRQNPMTKSIFSLH